MLNLKKVIASVCVIAMVLSTVAFGATYTDVAEDSAYYEAVETLNKLEIATGYEDGTFKPEGGVTRAEMAAFIARIQGYGETAKGAAETQFVDVPSSHWASGYIRNAAGMGIINGHGDGTFTPDEPVLYEQAVKMIMATLGYTPFAEKNGGYPTGYLAAAQRYDVSLAVANAVAGQPANRGTVAQLLVNAIDTPLMVQSQWNTNGEVTYVIADGKTQGGIRADYKTLMSENLGYVKVRGIVTNTGLVSVDDKNYTFDTTDEAALAINVVDAYKTDNKDFEEEDLPKTYEFYTGELDVTDYLGKSVVGYVKELSNDEYELVSIAVDTNRNDELVINVSDYAGIEDGEITYYKQGANDVTEVKVSDVMDVVYNNKCVTVVGDDESDWEDQFVAILGDDDAITQKGGAITLIDNDDVKGYDVAIIKLAETGVVDEVAEDYIAFKNDTAEIEIDVEDETKMVVVMKGGVQIDAAELAEWDILSIYRESDEADVTVAEVIGTKVIGTVASMKKSNTSYDGQAYKVNDAWYDTAEGAYAIDQLDVREGGTFYIDEFGKIAAFVEDAALAGGSIANYAYVAGFHAEPASFGATGIEVSLQLVTKEGVVIAPVKNNASVKNSGETLKFTLSAWEDNNGENVDYADEKFDADDVDYTELEDIMNIINGQVISYTKSATGTITAITAADASDKFENKGYAADGCEFDAENSKLIIDSKSRYIDEDAIIFIIDEDEADESYVGGLADLDDKSMYDVLGTYADNKADSINIVVIDKATVAAAGTTANLAVITSVGEADNEDGELIYELSYYLNGSEVTAKTNADVVVALEGDSYELNEGDVVKVKVGSEGVITNITVVYDFSEAGLKARDIVAAEYTPAEATEEVFFGGRVEGYVSTTKEMVIDNDLEDEDIEGELRLSKADNIYVIDYTGKNLIIKNGSASSYSYYKKLYADGVANADEVTVDEVEMTVGEAKAEADHVYVRTLDEQVTDVIIVKAGKLDID